MKKKKYATRSTGFKIFLFILLGISFGTGLPASIGSIYLLHTEAYNYTETEYLYESMRPLAVQHMRFIMDEDNYPTYTDIREALQKETQEYNIGYSLAKEALQLYQSKNFEQGMYSYSMKEFLALYGDGTKRDYTLTLYVDTKFPKVDEFRKNYRLHSRLYRHGLEIFGIAVCSVLVFVICFFWLMCNSGRRSGEEGLTPSIWKAVPIEIFTVLFGVVAVIPFGIAYEYSIGGELADLAVIIPGGIFEAVWFTIFCRELVLRVKLGKWWQNSLICWVLRLLRRMAGGLAALLREIPSIWHVAVVILLLSFCEYCGINRWVFRNRDIVLCAWLAEKVVLVPILFYCSLAFKKLQQGSQALAEGNLTAKLDTKNLYFAFKRHGENLNQIGEGISKAVDQRMRSERLKTELITNVSHDLKTPLTSVINYADLLGTEAGREDRTLEREKIAEYAEVLVRQSKRLKKLLDDLLEASKATTGSLEVNPAPCELGVLLTQAAGEYEARFAERGLNLHIRQPEEEIRIMADGRHLWRVFDNLLGNICKYAQDNSRVYIDMGKKDSCAEIIFRNISKYELNVSAQELEERFVRGDKSRNMEGNGLGLSIAKSLVELQSGTMEIVTDGDLFKVILRFPVLES